MQATAASAGAGPTDTGASKVWKTVVADAPQVLAVPSYAGGCSTFEDYLEATYPSIQVDPLWYSPDVNWPDWARKRDILWSYVQSTDCHLAIPQTDDLRQLAEQHVRDWPAALFR